MSRHFFGVPGEFVPILVDGGPVAGLADWGRHLVLLLLLLSRRLRVEPPPPPLLVASCGLGSSYRSVVTWWSVVRVVVVVVVVVRNDAPHKNNLNWVTFTTWLACVLVSIRVGLGKGFHGGKLVCSCTITCNSERGPEGCTVITTGSLVFSKIEDFARLHRH